MYAKNEKRYLFYVSKHNSNHEKQIIFLMILIGEGWPYLAVKILSALLREITSKYHSDFYCLNYLHFFASKNALEFHKKECGNKGFCNIIMPSEDTKTLQFNKYQKLDNALFTIYADL